MAHPVELHMTVLLRFCCSYQISTDIKYELHLDPDQAITKDEICKHFDVYALDDHLFCTSIQSK